MSTPKVSIGMPVYNGSPFIREALDSLLNQTFTDFELIISDNASTDETESICREYAAKDPRIRYVRQPENRGALLNFRFVLDEAVGEYFMWAAADDMWSSKWIEELLPVAIKSNVLVYGLMRNINQSNEDVLYKIPLSFSFRGPKFIRRLSYFCNHFAGKANPIYGLTSRKDLLHLYLNMLSAEGGDTKFLFSLLSDIEIVGHTSVTLYKRLNRKEELTDKSRISLLYSCKLAKICLIVFKAVNKEFINSYKLFYGICNFYEKFVILLLFPVVYINVWAACLRYLFLLRLYDK
jgi:glycosyltransferase involved in cell wall biosynthesis